VPLKSWADVGSAANHFLDRWDQIHGRGSLEHEAGNASAY
jgi:hypothetical protein